MLSVKGNAGDAIIFYVRAGCCCYRAQLLVLLSHSSGVTPVLTPVQNYVPTGSGPGAGSYADGTARPAALPDSAAWHSGCPVLEGTKLVATRWVRSSSFYS